ncbi:MAG: hypothetical protein Q7U56_01130 [Humidesulfovibrio sp.]|nr:hypothetical protein [Humidesulfovibrio sp.]
MHTLRPLNPKRLALPSFLTLLLCLLLSLPLALPDRAFCAQPEPPAPAAMPPKQQSKLQPKPKPKPKGKAKAKGAAKTALPLPPAPGLSREDFAAPYSALLRQTVGPPREEPAHQGGGQISLQSNATSWKVSPSVQPGGQQDESPVQFRLGRDTTVLDPVTKKELTPRADPLGAKRSLEELDLKGALDKLGGKAEIQVEVLKF